MTTQEHSVIAENLSKGFVQGEEHITVLEQLNLTLNYGEVIAILGPSGSGKSTLLNILGLLSTPDEGTYVLDEEDTSALNAKERALLRLHKIAFVFQAFHLIDHKNVFKNVELPLIYQGVPPQERAERVKAIIERLGLSHRLYAKINTLSGGEKQRVAIARALVTEPKVLLCDEPTGSLDAERTQEVIALLREVTGEEQTTIVVTHDSDVARECDHCLRVESGRLVEDTRYRPSANTAQRVKDSSVVPVHAIEMNRPRWFVASIKEAFDASIHRMRRNLFTMFAVALGIASLVLTVGLTATISGQLSDAFDVFLAQRVTLEETSKTPMTQEQILELEQSAPYKNLKNLHGVKNVALMKQVVSGAIVTSAPVLGQANYFQGTTPVDASVYRATSSVFVAQGQNLIAGRLFDQGHSQRADQVAVVGEGLLQRLNITWSEGLYLYVKGVPISIIGVVSENPSLSETYASIYVPLGSKLTLKDAGSISTEPLKIILATDPGATNQVGQEAVYTISPDRPGKFTAVLPPEPKTLRNAVDTQQKNLLIAMSLVTLSIGAIGIMNTFLVAVIERRKEIGLRLAIGTDPRGILLQIAAESIMVSVIGTIAGIVLAVNVIAVVCLINQWTPIIGAETIGIGLLSGLLVGVLAGLYPAFKASRVEPVQTLSEG
ncbi:ATP-binding cassette domain-containing protein [Rothia sp. P6271]|uniref:ABC transporter ATP-binding protein/permease n=1 Tax=Rothia sp. P6271 TaxID=3402659 RepID=UPI003AC30126